VQSNIRATIHKKYLKVVGKFVAYFVLKGLSKILVMRRMISDGYISSCKTILVTGDSFGQGNRLISQGNNSN
jgi:hypothetical protein